MKWEIYIYKERKGRRTRKGSGGKESEWKGNSMNLELELENCDTRSEIRTLGFATI